ncbi:hypothetical protein [Marinicella litoralis]|uniref:Uncharacterized protein n=1 Tax=Marinicella litoralis TaxID=644220 RepID=A0A4V3DIM7_9GAMM|nr:hypothetical protein [Marinicella litoralis]TDR22701.1 hypothetical protein C8D91_1194 [Marinicella litoralis]
MKAIIFILASLLVTQTMAAESWLDNLMDDNKKAEINQRWHADGGEMNLLFYYGRLQSLGIEVKGTVAFDTNNWTENTYIMPIKNIGGLSLKVPYGNLIGIDQGVLSLAGQFEWHHNGQVIEFNGLTLRVSNQHKQDSDVVGFEMVNDQGQVLFYFDHVHSTLDVKNQFLNLENMDVSISPTLAKILDEPKLSGLTIGQAHIQSHLTLPPGGYQDIKSVEGGSCANRPLWPGDPRPSDGNPAQVDVFLTEMNASQRRNLNNGYIVVTPSAELRNGIANPTATQSQDMADVAWYTKYSGTFAPYQNAQHPFLIWNMYRIIDDRIEQIGVSGVKHAFLTINFNCDINCNNGHILWPGCEDIYGVGNNDSGSSLGPRENIEAYKGLWTESPSFFDPNNSGSQTNSSNGTDENRMVVAEADLGVPGAEYVFSSWYLVRDDINIFNTMGYKPYSVTESNGNWFFQQQANLTLGAASDSYVTPNSFDLSAGTASARKTIEGAGHVTLAVRVVDQGNGQYTYNYMVENHDFDPQVQAITLPLNDLASMTDFIFADTDEDAGNDWTVSRSNHVLTLQAPAGNEIDWGILYSFSFTSNAEPIAGDVEAKPLGVMRRPIIGSLIVPGDLSDLIFENDFEILN